jgi:hypothetical protein
MLGPKISSNLRMFACYARTLLVMLGLKLVNFLISRIPCKSDVHAGPMFICGGKGMMKVCINGLRKSINLNELCS